MGIDSTLYNIIKFLANHSGVPTSQIPKGLALLVNRAVAGQGTLKEQNDVLKIAQSFFVQAGGKTINFEKYRMTNNREKLAKGSQFLQAGKKIAKSVGERLPTNVKSTYNILKEMNSDHILTDEQERYQVMARELIREKIQQMADVMRMVSENNPAMWNDEALSQAMTELATLQTTLLRTLDMNPITFEQFEQLSRLSVFAEIFWYEGNDSGTGRVEDVIEFGESSETWQYLSQRQYGSAVNEFVNEITDIFEGGFIL